VGGNAPYCTAEKATTSIHATPQRNLAIIHSFTVCKPAAIHTAHLK
jgi:hypothetical protein